MNERVLFIKPKFKAGDVVTCKYWGDRRGEEILEVLEDGLAKFYRMRSGTYGEGALTMVETSSARSGAL